MRVLTWHLHGAWTTAFVRGTHDYLIPVTPERDAWGLGRARTYPWPDRAVERTPEQLRTEPVDLVVLQRPEEIELAERWLGRRPGVHVPAVYVEHNTPRGDVTQMRHPLAERCDIPVVHVTHFNQMFWDCGRAPTTVIEHGIPDPGYRYVGDLPTIGVAVNEPMRRGRVTGTDLLPRFASAAPLHVFGMQVAGLARHLRLPEQRLFAFDDVPQAEMHDRLARCRVYLHPIRWTSLGLSLLEAMHLGMPVVALASTEAVEAVPPEAGAISTSIDALLEAVHELVHDPERARAAGRHARQAALARYGLARFLADWDQLMKEVAG